MALFSTTLKLPNGEHSCFSLHYEKGTGYVLREYKTELRSVGGIDMEFQELFARHIYLLNGALRQSKKAYGEALERFNEIVSAVVAGEGILVS